MNNNYKIDQVSETHIQIYNEDEQRFLINRADSIAEMIYSAQMKEPTFYRRSAISSIVQTINLMKYETCVEVGVSHGHSTVTLLDCCPHIKTLYSIDFYQPYIDYYTSNYEVDTYECNIMKNIALRLINSSPNKHKLKFYEEDSNISVERFKDNELDFVFLDAHLNSEHIKNDLEKWYPKVKSGGLVAIHDANFETVVEEIELYMDRINFTGRHSLFDKTYCLFKI